MNQVANGSDIGLSAVQYLASTCSNVDLLMICPWWLFSMTINKNKIGNEFENVNMKNVNNLFRPQYVGKQSMAMSAFGETLSHIGNDANLHHQIKAGLVQI